MWNTPSLPLLPGPLWPGVVVPDRVLSMGQIEQSVCKQMTDIKLWLLYSNTWNHLTFYKQMCSSLFKNVINKMCLQMINIYLVYMYKEDLALNNQPSQIKLNPECPHGMLYYLKTFLIFYHFVLLLQPSITKVLIQWFTCHTYIYIYKIRVLVTR